MTPSSLAIPILVNPSPGDVLSSPFARVSIPLARGAFSEVPALAVKRRNGEEVASQSELLARWPGGSIRVLHLTFAAQAGSYQATVKDEAATVAHPQSIVTSLLKGQQISVTTGRLHAVLGGASLVQSIYLGDKKILEKDGIEICVQDETGRTFTASATKQIGMKVEVEGPLRTVIVLKGSCTLGEETFLNFRLRFEFLAGVEGFSLSYTFFNLQAGQDFLPVQSIALEIKLACSDNQHNKILHSVYQQSYGLFSSEGRMVTTSEPLHIAVDGTRLAAYVENFSALGDDNLYPFYLDPPPNSVDNWVAVSNEERTLLVEMDDFNLLRPKSLTVDQNTMCFGVWPRQAGVLELQQGRSREVTVRVALEDSSFTLDRHSVAQRVAQLRDLYRAQLPPVVYADARFFDQGRVLPFMPGEHPRFEQWLQKMSSGLDSIATFFDLGDTPDSGYQASTITTGNRVRRIRSEDGGQRYFSSGQQVATQLNGLEDFEPFWVNNEYDAIFCLGTEYLRTGDCSLLQKLRWWSRHTIDVDFLHYSDHQWLHRAQPAHSPRHTTTGAYPSHFWTQGLAQYYFLTGDLDALEVIIALADKTIENFEDPEISQLCQGLNREVGWGILSLVCAYEASGQEDYDAYARNLLLQEMQVPLPEDIPVFSFGHTSILLGARQYLQVHEGEQSGEDVKSWFLEFVDIAIRSSRPDPIRKGNTASGKRGATVYSYDMDMMRRGSFHSEAARLGIFSLRSMALDSLAYAHEITGDPRYIESGLRSLAALLDSPHFVTPKHEGKPFAMVYRTFINYLRAAAELGYLQDYEYQV